MELIDWRGRDTAQCKNLCQCWGLGVRGIPPPSLYKTLKHCSYLVDHFMSLLASVTAKTRRKKEFHRPVQANIAGKSSPQSSQMLNITKAQNRTNHTPKHCLSLYKHLSLSISVLIMTSVKIRFITTPLLHYCTARNKSIQCHSNL